MGCHSWAVNTLLGPSLTPNWEFNYYTLYKWPFMFDLPINSMVMFHSFWYVLKISSRWDPPYGSPVPVPVIVNPQRGVSVTASGSKRSGEYGSIGSNTIGFWIIPQYIGEYNPQLIWLVVFRPSEKWWSSSVGMMIIPNIWKIKNVPNHQPVTSLIIDRSSMVKLWTPLPKVTRQ